MPVESDHHRLIEEILNHPTHRNESRRRSRKIKARLESLGIRELEIKLAELKGEPNLRPEQ